MQRIQTSTISENPTLADAKAAHPGARMNCDRVARFYQAAEYLAFGGALQRCRTMYLRETADRRRALLCGDGDGRFLGELLRANREVQVDFVDLSAGMIELARRRVDAIGSLAARRTSFHAGDVRDFEPAERGLYDLITAHFFLDCFDDGEAMSVARKLAAMAQPGARLLLSDFRIPKRGRLRFVDAAIVRSLYAAFRLTTGLRVTRLPKYEDALKRAGFRKKRETLRLGGLLVASLWERI